MTNITKEITKYLETRLNQLSVNLDYDIVFDGNYGFYHHDWVKEKFGSRITPFVLTTNSMRKANSNDNTYNFTYTLVALPFEKDRDKIEDLFNRLNHELDRELFGDYKVRFLPNNIAFGGDFSEGSGLGFRRFEALFEFNGTATTSYGLDSLELKFSGIEIPVNSFKYEHSKTNPLSPAEEEATYENSYNLNSNLLVVETVLGKDNKALQKFVALKNQVNTIEDVLLGINVFNEETEKYDLVKIIEDSYIFENYTLTYDSENDKFIVYLYFSYKPDFAYISIDGDEIPILDYSISMMVDSVPHVSPNTNTISSIFLNKARGYAFNVSEDEDYDVLNRLTGDLIGDNEEEPIYDVVISIRGDFYTKRLLLTDIEKSTRSTANSILTLKFLDGSDL